MAFWNPQNPGSRVYLCHGWLLCFRPSFTFKPNAPRGSQKLSNRTRVSTSLFMEVPANLLSLQILLIFLLIQSLTAVRDKGWFVREPLRTAPHDPLTFANFLLDGQIVMDTALWPQIKPALNSDSANTFGGPDMFDVHGKRLSYRDKCFHLIQSYTLKLKWF